ncbi:hypothetical protein SY83_13695 [Paenibacillus swuensis]|uniref:Uncharacterized protein n=1 Tax=Paenibacillus swuensis TaxID=1178515 RepID=A0A172TJB2_9BACL|nr:hypothetical protein [Paenibacillus swuensis]ANE47141.1 hypothetical protein SY83_13695 [Paenibacillus swuensis]
MKASAYGITLLTAIMITGCEVSGFATEAREQKIEQSATQIQKSEETKEPKRFSYLDQLPPTKIEAYQQFLKDRNLIHFEDFSPEDIFTTYLHAVAEDEFSVIYHLSYHNGSSPKYQDFKEIYNKHLKRNFRDLAFNYRYFDSLEIQDDMVTEHQVAVTITAGVGNFTSSDIYGLKKENKVWKMDVHHLVAKKLF